MTESTGKIRSAALPPIPLKRYYTIGEVSKLCGVQNYVLRYWEKMIPQLKPNKRQGNRRYYQHHEILLIRRIRELLYEQGFTISGAINQLAKPGGKGTSQEEVLPQPEGVATAQEIDLTALHSELEAIMAILSPPEGGL